MPRAGEQMKSKETRTRASRGSRMCWELSKGGKRRKATSCIPLEIPLRSSSSSEVVVEGPR